MQPMTIKEIVNACSGALLAGSPDKTLTAFTTDSRNVPLNALFVPIRGENADGHNFLDAAVKNGAEAVLSAEKGIAERLAKDNPSLGVILVKDTTEAFQEIAKAYRKTLKLPAVGVTGSVGKTTTREMVSAALSSGLKVFKTEKNFNNWLGTPTTLLSMTDEDDIAVLELGLRIPGELGRISSLANLDCAVITNIGSAHMEFYGSREEICKEKFTITRGFSEEEAPEKRRLFLNADDPLLYAASKSCIYPCTLYGFSEEAEYRGVNLRQEAEKTVFDFVRRGEFMFSVTLSVPGDFNVQNALAALAVADRYNLNLKQAAEKLSQYTGFKGRLMQHQHKGVLIIDDTYNASPDSMKGGLDILEKLSGLKGTKTAVLSDMFELGENTDAFHYEVGAYAAGKKIDRLFLTGEFSKQIKKGAEENGAAFEIRWFDTKEDLLSCLLATLQPLDAVYLKASNGMKLSEVTEGLLNA